jgi:hypothetical protein
MAFGANGGLSEAPQRGGNNDKQRRIGDLFTNKMRRIIGYKVTKTFKSDEVDPVINKTPIYAPPPEPAQQTPQSTTGRNEKTRNVGLQKDITKPSVRYSWGGGGNY